jgi:MtN3 and saliva related transmembrane protein
LGKFGLLLLTLMRQVYTQWRIRSDIGVSKWLFIGQLTAYAACILYSFLLHNLVFVCSNIANMLTAVVGEAIFVRNKRLKASGAG